MAGSQANASFPLGYASDVLQGTDSAGRTQIPLVGSAGQEFVQLTLSTNDPQSAITDIQLRGGLQDPKCKPLLGLLDQLGLLRSESHRHILEGGKAELLARISRMHPDKLLQLLELSFPFIGISDLRAVPLAVLDRLQPVPATFLKQLATDRDLFWELPTGVQRQVWELDKKLLQTHALPLLWGYTYETATVMRALDMDDSMGAATAADGKRAAGGGSRALPQLPRRVLRSGSASLQRLATMVGRSRQIYKGIVELCCYRYRDSDSLYVGMKEAALCTLRCQILMALHDQGETELCQKEPCHKLAWTLDACLKDRALDERRLRELANFFQPYQGAEERAARSGGQARRGGTGPARVRSRGRIDEDAESAGAPGISHAEEPNRELGDAGMVLRDPSTMHLILHQVLRCLEGVVEREEVPGTDRELIFLTRLLQLAVGCRAQMREHVFDFPEASEELLGTFYPVLAAVMLESQLREPDDQGEPDPDDENLGALVPLLTRDEIVRRVCQAYCLQRLGCGDLATGRLLLTAMAEASSRMSDKAIPEFAPFGFTLARRMASLLAEGRVDPEHPLWKVAVDSLLIKLVDSETQVHEEVLRLLLAAAPRIPLLQLANYLHTTLAHSRRSRKRWKKRKLGGGDPDMAFGGYGSGGGYTSADGGGGGYHSSGYHSTGWGGPGTRAAEGAGAAARSADGVRTTYQLFTARVPGLNATVAPSLFAYLDNP